MYKISNSKVSKSQIKIDGELKAEAIVPERAERLKKMRANFSYPGFRKGHAPEDIFLKHVDPEGIWEESARNAMLKIFQKIAEEMKLKIIGSPKISLDALKPESGAKFTAEAALVPEFKLPDYKKIAARFKSEKSEIEVAEDEIDKLLETIAGLESRGKPEKIEVSDELARSLGASSLADLREKLKTDIRFRKSMEEKKNRREKMAEGLLKETRIDIPPMLIEEELASMMNRLREDLGKRKVNLDEYAKQIGKSADAIEEEYRSYVTRQLETQFLLDKIAETEKIFPTEYEIEEGIKAVRKKYPQAELTRIYEYVVSNIINEKVLQFLEEDKEEVPES